MNVSQALRRISQIKGSIGKWTARRAEAVQWNQTTGEPAYSFGECQENLVGAAGLRSELVTLRTKLAIANATNTITLPNGDVVTLTEATIALSEIKSEIAALSTLRTNAQKEWTVQTTGRYNRATGDYEQVDVPHWCSFTTRERDARVEELTQQFQETNAILEAANHRVEV